MTPAAISTAMNEPIVYFPLSCDKKDCCPSARLAKERVVVVLASLGGVALLGIVAVIGGAVWWLRHPEEEWEREARQQSPSRHQ
jgi:hypothetical protein